MMTRRQAVTTSMLGGAMLAGGPASAERASAPAPAIRQKTPLANFGRARQLMAQHGLDALVVRQSVNVRYFAGYEPFLTRLGFETPGLVVVPADPLRPATLIASSVDVWRLSQQDEWHPENIIPFTGTADLEALKQASMPQAYSADMGWPIQEQGLTQIDKDMIAYVDRFSADAAPSPQWGLVKALRDLGLEKSVIGYDDAAIAQMIAGHGLDDVTCRDGINLIRRIRMVKTAGEVGLMRTVGERNAAAANAAMAAIQPGMTLSDIQRLFAIETAKRDLAAVFIVAGSLHELPHGEVVEGEPILVDAVSSYQGYHGDYGRTFLLGEAPRAFKPKTQKLQIAWQAAFDMIRPGVRYSEIRAAAIEAVRKAAIGEQLSVVNPHSVGLQHTDEPGIEDMPSFVKDDIVLEAGMTMTVDLPHLEPGWGACHLEDLIVVTENGAEPLHDMSRPVVEL
ncbi:MAG: Xaa-Pro peptidase family protein [Pseudomonadota bacterium]